MGQHNVIEKLTGLIFYCRLIAKTKGDFPPPLIPKQSSLRVLGCSVCLAQESLDALELWDLALNYRNARPLEGRKGWECCVRQEQPDSLKDATQGMQSSSKEQDGGVRDTLCGTQGLATEMGTQLAWRLR